MNILGVGGPELLIILVLMYVIFGPKRMIQYARVLGQYVAKFRRMNSTMQVWTSRFHESRPRAARSTVKRRKCWDRSLTRSRIR